MDNNTPVLPAKIAVPDGAKKRIVEQIKERDAAVNAVELLVSTVQESASTYLNIPLETILERYMLRNLDVGFELQPDAEEEEEEGIEGIEGSNGG